MHADEQEWYPELPHVTTGLEATLAVGSVAAGIARFALIRAASTATVGIVRLDRRLLAAGARHARTAHLVQRGGQVTDQLEHAAAEAGRRLLRRVVEAAASALDLTDLVRRHVDLDALAATLDVDAVVARADLPAVVARIDLDSIVDRIDIDAIAASIDLDAIVHRIDVDAIVDRVDVDAVIGRVDIDAIAATIDVDTVVARVDLDAIMQRVEPDSVVERVDVEAVVARLDLPALTRQVIAAIDLAEVLRESSSSVSSQAARVVRTEGMQADETVSRWVDRVLRRPHPGAVGG